MLCATNEANCIILSGWSSSLTAQAMEWKRFLTTLAVFRKRYGHWPTRIHFPPFFIRQLENRLPPEDFLKLNSKIQIIRDQKSFFLAQDDEGHSLDYPQAKKGSHKRSDALEWLGIQEPDYSFKIVVPAYIRLETRRTPNRLAGQGDLQGVSS